MLVGEPFMQQLPVPEYSDISDLLNSDLFSYNHSNSPSPPSSSSSPRSPPDPFHLVLTPPQSTTSFPTIASDHDLYNSNSNNLNLIQEELFSKSMFTMPSVDPESFDFLGANGFADSPASTSSSAQPLSAGMCIDPQLVGSPSVHDDEEDEERQEDEAPLPPAEPEYIPPAVKGKSRKNTVQSGGITKRTHKDKENVKIPSFSPPPSLPASIYKEEDDNDELPADWRPPPEVYAKMSSKEKRQLRNKISARNFRIRRKEYITTLEGDIAERDRILDAIRSELGSSRDENYALRQEIAALKKVLLPGRSDTDGSSLTSVSESPELSIESILNLPPPAPLPEISAAEMLAARASPSTSSTASTAELNLPNTQKDLPTSPRGNVRSFWGGAHLGLGAGGFTPVHTAIMPEWPIARNIQNLPMANAQPTTTPQLQENLNPAMNKPKREGLRRMDSAGLTPFEKFTDSTMLTYPSMDPYRMQLWKLVAAQNANRTSPNQQLPHVHQPHQHQYHPTGLAANMRPHFFSQTSSPKLPTSSSSPTFPHTVPSPFAGLLPGKSRALGGSSTYNSAPSSSPPSFSSSAKKDIQKEAEQAQRDEMVVALASQTLMSKLGSAFWEAFSGGSSSSASSRKNLDAEKVRRVLEGKAVVQVVDVDSIADSMRDMSMSASPTPAAPRCDYGILEESMRSLTLGKKH
ncbi:hypothetical protein BDV98DRAFT_98471 [Pterulicium gracile]|uniref:BZIP domain-containing protein n=1 Tax=Pterulicium gracile TaxID=1884261 RepID=A0A5C3QHX6_9AGAR|nr:hypothetical protein BDV98DRAFT_98471 [Pterula gracilis]